MKKLGLLALVLTLGIGAADASDRLSGQRTQRVVRAFLRSEVREQKITAFQVRYCRRYSPRWVHCKVSEYSPGEELRYGIDAKLRGNTIYLSSLAFGPMDQASMNNQLGR